jgi:hypothetical protein
MEKNLEVEGHVPLKDEKYKLLLNNIFTPSEMGCMASSLASSLQAMMQNPKAALIKPQINTVTQALGKILLAMPDQFRGPVLKMFKEKMGLDFQLKEVQKPEEPKTETPTDGLQH